MCDHSFRNPFCVSVINTSEYFCSFILRILEYNLQHVLKTLISLQFLGSLLSPFLNMGVMTAFLHSFGMQFSLYILFKNCSNLNLNSTGAYSYSSELIYLVLELYHFLLVLTPFLVHPKLQKHVSNRMSFILIVIHLCLLYSVTFHSIEGIHFCLCFLEYALFLLHPY